MVAERLADGSIRMTTRTGKVVSFLNHIREALHKILPVGVVLDGELFTTDRTFEEITGIVRRSVKAQRDLDESEQICYHIFDAFHRGQEAMSYVKRKTLVHDTLRDITAESPLVIVPTVDIGSQEDADETHVTFVAEGHEGTIYRTPEAPYKIRLRSRDLLKRKDFITDEYRIVGATQGVGKDDGSVIWVVETSPAASGAGDAPGVDPQRFNVRPRGSLEQRRRWWDDRDSYVDKMITVRFQNLTEGGIPRFPVGLTVRDYE
jgi:DNA ligase-1